MASNSGYFSHGVPPAAINNTYGISTSPPSNQAQQPTASRNNINPFYTEPSSPQNSRPRSSNPFYMALDQPTTNRPAAVATSVPQQPPKETAFFLFFNCQTTGSNIQRDRIVELAVQCWPYVENAPTFNSKVDRRDAVDARIQRVGKHEKSSSTVDHPDDGSVGHPFPVVWQQLMQWIERILNHATSIIQMKLYPVFVTHYGDTYDFHFLFRSLEDHGIGLEALSNLNIHFCDPVPLLKQYKDHEHPYLVESRSMAVGSLLNDWLPGQFDIGDLYICPGKTWLAAKLYTQTPMYWLMKDLPCYSTREWIEYYKEVKEYKEDKKSLDDNFPDMPEVQRKFAIRSLLRWGYNWDGLVALFKSCGSPEQFRQEVKDCDVKSGVANQLTWKLVDEKIPQDGTRQYKVRIKENMPPQRYTHLTDRRGRLFILRVQNMLPPFIHSVNDLMTNVPQTSQWKVPDNLLLIRYPEAWCTIGNGQGPGEEEIIEQMQLGNIMYNSDDYDDSQDSWDQEEDEEAAKRQSLQPIEDLFKEQQAAPPITTLHFGNAEDSYNPFGERKQKGLENELRKEENAQKTKELWALAKRDDVIPQQSTFGAVIKFCRPGGMEDTTRAMLKKKGKDKDYDEHKDKKGNDQKNRKPNRQRNNNSRSGRRQSWTSEAHEDRNEGKQSQGKTRTVSCSADIGGGNPESSVSTEQVANSSNVEDDVNAAAHRMINFHLAANNNKKTRNRRNKNGRRPNNTSESNEGNQHSGKGEESDKSDTFSGNRNGRKPHPASSPGSNWADTAARGQQTGWGNQGKNSFENSTTGSAWGHSSKDKCSKTQGTTMQQDTAPPHAQVANNSKNGIRPGSIGAVTNTTSKILGTPQSWGRDESLGDQCSNSDRGSVDTEVEDDCQIRPVMSFSRAGNRGDNNASAPGSVRRPREASKAQTLAANFTASRQDGSVKQIGTTTLTQTTKAAQNSKPFGAPLHGTKMPQNTSPFAAKAQGITPAQNTSPFAAIAQGKAPPSAGLTPQVITPTKVKGHSNTPLVSKTIYGPPPRNAAQSQNTKPASGFHDNVRRNGQNNNSKPDIVRYSAPGATRNKEGNNQGHGWNNKPKTQPSGSRVNRNGSKVTPAPVITNHVEDTENWDDEVDDDQCYGL